jgi:uncharacterized protein YebE (UPF0316 family)
MDWAVIGTCALIFIARIADVSMGTLRTVWIVQGRRWTVLCMGFVEILIWIFAVSAVVDNLDKPVYAVVYAAGFATGNFVGVTIEKRLAQGEQVVRIFSRQGREIATRLREKGYGVTVFRGEGHEGDVDMCFIETLRKKTNGVIAMARAIDATCYLVIDDVQRALTAPSRMGPPPTGWRSKAKKK